MNLLDQPVAAAEFLALDTETNGHAGDLCELTEVGAVLVGGGELHETFDSLVRMERPLSRGIQRFTGITQAMVDSRAAAGRGAARSWPSCSRAACWSPTTRASTGACCARHSSAAGSTGPGPPALCTVQLARRFAPLARKRALAPLAGLARHRGG